MKKIITLSTFAFIIILASCSNTSKKEEAKNNWKEKTYSDASNTQTVSAPVEKTGNVKILTDKDFDNVISEGITMVDFWATWCRPCLMQAPVVEEIAGELEGNVKVYKMDVDRNPYVPQRFNIQNIPTIMVFKDGKMVEHFVGLQQKATLVDALNRHQKNS